MPFDAATSTHAQQRTQYARSVNARIRYARSQITKGRWCQNTINDDHGNRCLVGWLEFDPGCNIGHAAISHVWWTLPRSAQRTGGGSYDLARYNDTHTRHTIIRLLNRAIVALETM